MRVREPWIGRVQQGVLGECALNLPAPCPSPAACVRRGAFSVVRLGKHKETGQEVAVKVIGKNKMRNKRQDAVLRNEIEVMSRVRARGFGLSAVGHVRAPAPAGAVCGLGQAVDELRCVLRVLRAHACVRARSPRSSTRTSFK